MMSGILAQGIAVLFCSMLLVQKQVQGHVGVGVRTKCNKKGGMVMNHTHPPLPINLHLTKPLSARDTESKMPSGGGTDPTLSIHYQSTIFGLPEMAWSSFHSLLTFCTEPNNHF